MKKSLVVHVLVIVVSVGVSFWLGSDLLERHGGIAKSRSELTKAPMGGFNKFASDVHWMLFINYCGSVNSVTDDNVDEMYNRLNTILRNDPDFEKAYKIGAMMLSVQAPVRAAELLVRGATNPNLSSSWELPYLAGYVLANYVRDEDDKDRLRKAEDMLHLAVQRGNQRHVVSLLLRIKARRIEQRGKPHDGVDIANDEHAYLCALYDEWRSSSAGEPHPGILYGNFGSSGQVVSDMEGRILEAARNAKDSAPDNKDVRKTVETVMGKVLANHHLCTSCLSRYNPGDKFCSHCGSDVAVYGACKKCNAILSGRFCSVCGEDSQSK